MGGKGGYMERKLHGVIIEWDGVEVPSRWYSWLEGLTGFRVRDRDTHQPLQAFTPRSVIPDTQIREHLKDLETPEEVDSPESVFAKRANDFGGIAQEGAIIVASYSLARLLFFILDRGVPVTIRKTKETVYIRPANVYLMEIKVKETVARLAADEAALRRVENTIGKRGRKPPVAWWAALFLSLTVSRGIAEFLGSGLFQVIVLVVCPVLAAVVGMFSMRKTMKLQWITAFVGVGFAFLSLVASFRNS